MQISEIALDASDAASRQIRSDDIWAWWEKLTETERLSVLRGLNVAQRRELVRRWYGFQNDGQREPLGEWRIWLIQAGRGFGKTRAGAEWVSQVARDVPGARIALVAATVADGQRVMIEGPSGLMAVARAHEPVRWVRERRELRFASTAGWQRHAPPRGWGSSGRSLTNCSTPIAGTTGSSATRPARRR